MNRDELIETMSKCVCNRHDTNGWDSLAIKMQDAVRGEMADVYKAITDAGFVVMPREPTNRMVEGGGQVLPPSYSLTECYAMFKSAYAEAIRAWEKYQ